MEMFASWVMAWICWTYEVRIKNWADFYKNVQQRSTKQCSPERNSPIEKETHLPNLHVWVQCWLSPGCSKNKSRRHLKSLIIQRPMVNDFTIVNISLSFFFFKVRWSSFFFNKLSEAARLDAEHDIARILARHGAWGWGGCGRMLNLISDSEKRWVSLYGPYPRLSVFCLGDCCIWFIPLRWTIYCEVFVVFDYQIQPVRRCVGNVGNMLESCWPYFWISKR